MGEGDENKIKIQEQHVICVKTMHIFFSFYILLGNGYQFHRKFVTKFGHAFGYTAYCCRSL